MNIREIAGIAPVIPVLTIADLEHAVPLARALVAGGLRVLEVTLRTPIALEAISAIRSATIDAIVGAGTITRTEDFAAAVRAGAQFGVTPGLTPDLARVAGEVSLPLLPGVMTPTELIAARTAGFNVLKLFPAVQAGGIAMLRALATPFPEIVFCPTGGVTRETAADYLRLPNVVCVGGSWITPKDMIHRCDWRGIEALARDAASLSN